jgi:hypothetical protein
MWEQNNGANFCGINRKTDIRFQFEDYVLWVPKGKNTLRKIQEKMV